MAGKVNKKSVKSSGNASIKSVSMISEKDWMAKEDAMILKHSMEIKSDPKRMKAAQEHVAKEMESMKKIARMKP